MTGVGEKLRGERVRQGLDLATLARMTRIRERYLTAIEENCIEQLPGRFFYKSFVRQYAATLGIDGSEFEAELDCIETPEVILAPRQTEFPLKPLDPIVEESNRRYLGSGRVWAPVILLAVVVAGCSAVYAWWRHHEAAATVRPRPVAAESTAEKPRVEQHQEAAPAVRSSAMPKSLTMPVSPSPTAAQDSGSKKPVPSLETGAGEDAPIVLNVSATDEVRLSISSEGRRVFDGLMEPSESKSIGGKDPFRIRVENAGAIEITWNGKFIGPIGEKGQVKEVVFTPDTYQILTPAGSL
jgi:cytoskeletal protein RodZ